LQRDSFLFIEMAEEPKVRYGGQAVIEGVMIRGRKAVVTSVRRPNGELAIDAQPIQETWTKRYRRLPFFRGIVILIETMVIGIKSLLYSANIAVEEETEEIPSKAIWVMIALAAVLVVVLFFLAPLFLTRLINQYIPNAIVFNIIEGVIRLAIFLVYLKAISFMPDIKRVFTYHGAEHKTVNAYEAGVPLEVEAIRAYSTAHVRCGTSFLFTVLLIAIIVFSFMGRDILWLMVVSRIVLIPVIMGLGYEFIYFGARHTDNWLMRALLAPGLWLQSLTTGEPDDDQIEVAIAAMNKAVEMDQTEEAVPAENS
jgi:uncharacterized protein YqhQ